MPRCCSKKTKKDDKQKSTKDNAVKVCVPENVCLNENYEDEAYLSDVENALKLKKKNSCKK